MFLCYNIYNRKSVISIIRNCHSLVNFVLILLIFIFILFSIVDFGMILNKKSQLENVSVDIISRFKNNDSIEDIKKSYDDLLINFDSNDVDIVITITAEVDIMTPGLNLVLGDPHKITIERIIPNV